MPLELNCGSGVLRDPKQYDDGIRYAYPTRAFFEVFAERKCPVIIGLDIHDPKLFLSDKYLERALSVIEGLDVNLLEDYDLVEEAKKRKKLFY
jgi:histidinol-phosphatase (PHP family)